MGIPHQSPDIFKTVGCSFTGPKAGAPIYTASAPLSIAALPTTRSLAGDNNSTFFAYVPLSTRTAHSFPVEAMRFISIPVQATYPLNHR